MKVIKQVGDRFTVEMSMPELDALFSYLFDEDGKEVFLEGEELGDLVDHINGHISEISRLIS